jgi:uncharacterized protein (DUF2147 family)
MQRLAVAWRNRRERIVLTSASAGCTDGRRHALAAALLVIALTFSAAPGNAVLTTVPGAGAWFIEGTGAALQIFDCSGLLCGRIAWLEKARDTAGHPAQDNKNPEPAFRQRPLCGLTILRGLHPAGLDDWNSGSLYNPDDGQTYRVSAKLHSPDMLVARIYVGMPVFGETKTLRWVPRLGSEGRC